MTSPRLPRLPVAAAAAVLSAASPAGALESVDPDSAYAAALAEIRGEPLTLDDAVARALGQAADVYEAEAGVRAAEGALRRESGAFDPVLFAQLDYLSEDSQTASPFAGASLLETKQRFTAAGARLRLPTGTQLEASLGTTRLETNSSFAALDPQYASAGVLRLRQPLLNGFGPGTTGRRSAARRLVESARARLSDAALAVQADVTTTYWDLYAAERDLAVERLIVERARVFLAEAEKRAAAGLVGPNEVATAQVFLAEQQLAELDREERLDEVSDRLASLVGDPPSHLTGRYHPTTEPRSDVPVELEEVLLARALRTNGELQAARRDLEALEETARAARWNALPVLDVTGALGGTGLTGTARPVTFGDTTYVLDTGAGWGESLSEVLGRDSPSWSVGLELAIPIPLREGRGERDRLQAEVDRAAVRVLDLERTLREDVRARHRELTHGLRRLELARAGVDASMEQVRIGQIEYQNGRSTAFELVRLGADVAAAQERYSAALVRTAKAAAELERLAPQEER